MNMKFAALLLFVGVTSATWCWDGLNVNRCPGENAHGEATLKCCLSDNHKRGCWLTTEAEREAFYLCCMHDFDCLGITEITEQPVEEVDLPY